MFWWLSCLIVLGLLGLLWDFKLIAKPQMTVSTKASVLVPTLFIPGYYGNRYSFGHMLWRMHKRGQLDKQVVAIVKRDGHVKLLGQLQPQTRAAVQVLYQRKSSRPNLQQSGLEAVITALQQQADFDQVNLVAHSMGGVTAVLYMLSQPRVPVGKMVTIAAPLNDLEVAENGPISNWRITAHGPEHIEPIFAQFQATIQNLPPELRWLNIAGDILIGGRNDGVVSVNSSFAIRFLVKGKIDRYIEVIIRGPRATHSLLHENPLVDRDISQFLWPRR
ncbi:alpha/beta fold hydrolase [Lacticaseibacillus brantae]|uniref:Alpha beta hydrolase superfamily protein n=1 Tax=Lacticaseibacillus brantae DSM 23927 TaxID=1423727 RepID=A0A0R2AY89_9LACO|nr:alpha/beta fold hydrolase [Lacticaseibacillus brantae]KRM71490.1 alpha beta hydrolase superfamily protein [Lacticaseibacillus brantae DSM 23927]